MRDGNGAISLIYRAERYNTLLPYLLRLACIPYLAYILLPYLPTLHPPPSLYPLSSLHPPALPTYPAPPAPPPPSPGAEPAGLLQHQPAVAPYPLLHPHVPQHQVGGTGHACVGIVYVCMTGHVWAWAVRGRVYVRMTGHVWAWAVRGRVYVCMTKACVGVGVGRVYVCMTGHVWVWAGQGTCFALLCATTPPSHYTCEAQSILTRESCESRIV